MLRGQKQNEANLIIKRAVELSRVPGSGSRTSGAGRNVANHYNDISTTDDGSGGTVHVAMTELDFTNDPNAVTV